MRACVRRGGEGGAWGGAPAAAVHQRQCGAPPVPPAPQASRCAAAFRADLAALRLPQDAGALREAAGAAQGRALAKYRASALGAPGSGPAAALREELRQALAREAHLRAVENEAASNAVCGRLEGECEEALEGLQAMRLPSLWKYNTTLQVWGGGGRGRARREPARPGPEPCSEARRRRRCHEPSCPPARMHEGGPAPACQRAPRRTAS